MSDKIIIGLAGQKHTGKTTTANAIKSFVEDMTFDHLFSFGNPKHPKCNSVSILSFAFYLKDFDKKMFKIANPNATDKEVNKKRRPNLIKNGDLFKLLYGKDIFCKMLLDDIKRSDADIIIVDDVRYLYEAESLITSTLGDFDTKIFSLIKTEDNGREYYKKTLEDMKDNPEKYSKMHSSESEFYDILQLSLFDIAYQGHYNYINLYKEDGENYFKPKLQIVSEILCHYDKFKNLI